MSDWSDPERMMRVLADFPIRRRPDGAEVPAMGSMTTDLSMRRLYVEHGLIDGSVSVDVFAPHIDVEPDRMGGALCFRGTRVEIETLFANMGDMSADRFLEAYPTVDRADLEAVLRILRGDGDLTP